MRDWILKYWVEWLLGCAVGVLSGLYARLRKKARQREDEYKAIKDGQLALLHDRLYSLCMSCLEAGEVTVSALSNIEHLYNAYHALGGNGTGTELYERVRNECRIKEG